MRVRRLLPMLLIALACFCTTVIADDRPNVLFLICDDLNCDLACYGHSQVQSPNIDRLAARGVRFEHAYCQYPLCGPSRASFMTGLYPDQTLVHRNAIYIREHVPNVKTMSQMFRDNGYFATRIGKIYHYNVPKHIGTSGHDDPFSWDYTINPHGRDKDDEDLIFSLRPGSFGGTLSWLAADGTDEEQTDGIAATDAVRLLKEYGDTQQSFFMAVGLFRPHTPYVAPKKYFDLYPLDEIVVPQVPEGYYETIPTPAVNSLRRKKEQIDLPDDLARKAIQAYYASITFADAQLGRILDTLDESGLAESTVVVFTSDHGYHMGEHGYWQKTTLFENAARVPLIIAGPGTTARGQVAQTPAEMLDFYPTLAELCGLNPPKYLSGVSLAPVLKDPSAMPREAALTQYANGYSIRTPRYRYTEWGENGQLGRELYDHESDSQEMTNLSGQAQHAETMATLSRLLRERVQAAQKKPAGVTQIHFENRRRVR
ncbi:Choline-sulfatase [Maioricimonas rarisocia]|uniref:Choline-sulfatase n=1 Tax=Maioricimonas rarisocia TaxID=2528026 RepID=A0A517Z704_9PLAN|nr:sulfatase [Maioricimonas rarisocia]QDU38224.1 Choline-sulfatase [Maioricimonas rarisocia]